MRFRQLQILSLLLVMILLGILGNPEIAVSSTVPRADPTGTSHVGASVLWIYDPPSPFAGARFDAQYAPPQVWDTTQRPRPHGRIYILGFRTADDSTDGSVWYYDVYAKTYVDTGVDMPVPVSDYGIVALKDSEGLGYYIFGGRDAKGDIVTTVQAYYPVTNETRLFDEDPWPGTTPAGCVSLPAMGVTPSMAEGGHRIPRSTWSNQAVLMGGLSFAANGCSDDESAQTWLFNPIAPAGTRWHQGPELTVARGYITTTVLGDRIYAIGGDTISDGNLTPVRTVESWSLGDKSWDDAGVADLPEPCDESQAFGYPQGPLHNSLILAGCGQWPTALPDVLQYDPVADAWGVLGMLNEARRNQAGAKILSDRKSLQDKMYVLGGYGEDSGFMDPTSISELGKGRPVGVTLSDGSSRSPQSS